jgi:type II secretory pathway component PulF
MTVALERYKHVFGEVYIETLRAAEKSGSLQQVMNHLAEMLDRQIESRSQLKRAMAYPVIVLTMVSIALTIIVGFVVPKFAKTFKSNGAKLPLATRLIQDLGESVQTYWWAYAATIIGTIFATIMTWKNPKGRLMLEDALLRVPYISKIIVAVCTGRFARVFGISLTSGLDLIESLQIAGRATGRPVFVNDCDKMADKLRQGDRLVDAMRDTKYLPSFAKRMMGAGKDSQELSRACDIVARHYDRESSHLTKNMNTIIEPILTVAMAGIVLIVALAVFLPMWSMTKVRR